MFRKLLPFLGVALVVTIALSAFAFRPASARTTGSMTASSTVTNMRGGPGGGLGGEQLDSYLAKALGITTDQLQAAYQKARSAALDQAVKAGLITQTQADQLKADGRDWRGFPGLDPQSTSSINFDQLFADALGITTDKLQAAYQTAADARIDQAVTDGKLTKDQADLMKAQQALAANQNFQTALKTAYSDAVKKAVTDGVITQAQADLILKNNATPGFPGFGGGHGGPSGMPGGMPGFGGDHGGRGGMPGPAGQPNGNNPAYPAPSQAPSANGG